MHAVASFVLPTLLVFAAGRAATIDDHTGKSSPDLASQPEFTMDWSLPAPGAMDVSFLLEAPAGKSGRIVVKGGHLATGDGRRFRIWGINVTGGAGLPAKENAPRLAAQLARHGINCVRFHFLDRVAPQGVIAGNRDNTRELDAGQMDRLD